MRVGILTKRVNTCIVYPMKAGFPAIFALSAALLVGASCSFNYSEEGMGGPLIPGVVLTDATVDRYEDAKVSIELSAGTLEMYDEEKLWAGERIAFKEFSDEAGEPSVDADGSAGLILVDDGQKIYTLGAGVYFRLYSEELELRAEDLRWTRDLNVLAGPIDGNVEISKEDGTKIVGSGFFADTLSRSYEFRSSVSGTLGQKSNKPASDAVPPSPPPSAPPDSPPSQAPNAPPNAPPSQGPNAPPSAPPDAPQNPPPNVRPIPPSIPLPFMTPSGEPPK